MKINKFTSALIALGVVSLASAAQANTVIYLTGSTAARSLVAAALDTPGAVFTGAVSVLPSGTTTGANQVVFEGNITGLGTVDIDCSWSGSEAGIANVAGSSITQNVNGGTYALLRKLTSPWRIPPKQFPSP